MTSDEQRANWASGVGAQKDDVFVEMMENALTNVKYAGIGEAVVDLYAPELLRRFQLAAEEARNFGEALDNIRTALGQKETHYLVMADDVAVLVKTLEWYASKVLEKVDGTRAKVTLEVVRGCAISTTCEVCERKLFVVESDAPATFCDACGGGCVSWAREEMLPDER